MRVLMLVQSPVAGDARVLREAATLAEAGHSVRIIGRDVPVGFDPPYGVVVDSVGRTRGLRRSDESLGVARPMSVPLAAARWLLLPRHRASVERAWAAGAEHLVVGERPDVVHAHDFNTLELASSISARTGAALVYDSHELWWARPRAHRPTPWRTRRERKVEQRLGTSASAVITVGEGVADALRDAYGWTHVTVVRNTFDVLPADTQPPLPGKPGGVLYAGRIAPHRELETLVAAAERLPDLEVVAAGPQDAAFVTATRWGKVQLRAAVGLDEVDRLLRIAGLALVSHSDRWLNHRLALPNKLFHAVRAGVPVVATDVPELRRIVRRHGIGTLYRAGDADDLVRAIRQAVDEYESLKRAVAAAGPGLSWKRDRDVLLDTYAALDKDRSD